MKRAAIILLAAVVLTSCGRSKKQEQKITIKIDAPAEKMGKKDKLPKDVQTLPQQNVQDLMKTLMARFEDLKPILHKIMQDETCRKLATDGDPNKLSNYLCEKHAGSMSEAASILGLEDDKPAALAVARHLVRKNAPDNGGRRFPARRRPRN